MPETVGDILIQYTTEALKEAWLLTGLHAWLWQEQILETASLASELSFLHIK